MRVTVGAGPNLEARARAARRAALPPGPATGHTMDDQAETVLLNLMRGAGLDGLAAMRPGPVHPMLALRRSETHGPVRAARPRPGDDPSNADRRFVRNRVRHELFPLARDIAGRDLVPVLARQAGLLADEATSRRAGRGHRRHRRRGAGAAPPSAGPAGHAAAGCWRRRPCPRSGRGRAGAGRGPGTAGATDVAPGVRVRRSAGSLSVGAGRHGRRQVGSAPDDRGARHGAHRRNRRRATGGSDDPDLGEVVVAEDVLQKRVMELGEEITADYEGRPPLLVGVLKGAFVFMSDLARAIALPVEVDVMAVASYGSATTTSGVVRIVKDLDSDLTGRHVLVVEDIVDSGLTLSYLRRSLLARQPGQPRGVRAARQRGPPTRQARPSLRRVPHPPGFRGGLWARCRRALPQRARHPRLPGPRPCRLSA